MIDFLNTKRSSSGYTHQKSPWGLYSLFSENQFVSLTQIARISQSIHRCRSYVPPGRKHSTKSASTGVSDVLSVKFVFSVWNSIIYARIFWCVSPKFVRVDASEISMRIIHWILTLFFFVVQWIIVSNILSEQCKYHLQDGDKHVRQLLLISS